MDGLSSAASVIGVIQLAGSIVKICGGYLYEVKDARDDINTLQRTVAGLEGILQKLKELLQGPHGTKLTTSSPLVNNINDCFSDLRALEKKIDPRKGQDIMRRLGIRAFKWPLKRTEMNKIIQTLERYKSSFTLSLQIDQASLLTGVAKNTERIDQNIGLDKLPIAHGAEFDSYMDQHEDECLVGTRTELLLEITEWARSPQGKCIFWLNGIAGTGKSTISRTVARSLKEAKLLGASFFFRRGEGDRGNATKLFSTITRYLVASIPQLSQGVQKALNDDPNIAGKSLKEQFSKLLFQPLLSLGSHNLQIPTVVIVIDALDECERDEDIVMILQLLPQLKSLKAVRLRIFLTSRPELPIRLGFSKIASHEHEDLVLHDIPAPVIEHDISLFLKHRISSIRIDRSLPACWPGDKTIQSLVELSVPLFIFAATACRILEDPQWDPVDSLTEIFTHRNDGSQFDGTYLPVLNRVLKGQSKKQQKQLVQDFRETVGAIVMLESPLSITSLSKFLGIPQGQIDRRLRSLHSVLSIPGDLTKPVRLFHLSFRDYLTDPQTRDKTPFWVDDKVIHQKLAARCFYVCDGLRKNICGLPSVSTKRAEINRQTIDHYLSPELQYSCRYWAHHLIQSKDPIAELDHALSFLRNHFLHWMEAMSILGHGSEVVRIINLLESDSHVSIHPQLSEFLHDAKRFVLKNRQMADEFPLQIYYSGLLFAPKRAIIRNQFKEDLLNWIHVLSNVQENWSAELQTLEGHSGWVWSVAFSPDGRLLSSASFDKTVRLWDAATGTLQQTLEGHLGRVHSVAFSPDSRLLASASDDNTVRLWDAATGTLQQTLVGHSRPVRFVAFSSGGRLLASASSDKTVRLWDITTGTPQQTLEGHHGWGRLVAFSPDGLLLALVSSDKTVRLWNTATGALQQTLKGHLGGVNSVVFAPGGRQLLASASSDETIRIWDIATGALQQTLEDHLGSVNSVAFSPDGRLLASASDDKTVRLWDMGTGALQQSLGGYYGGGLVAFSPDGRFLAWKSSHKTVWLWDIITDSLQQMEGHSGLVNSVAFSPDGKLLASASRDKFIRLWDTAKGSPPETEGHSGMVNSVVLSPDGQLLASASNDKTVRLWNTTTGALQQTFEGHSSTVDLVAFSPDGRLLASASWDSTVRLWDIATGALKQTLDGHHGWGRTIAFSPDGLLLASASRDQDIRCNNTVRLWDAISGSRQQTLEGHSEWVTSVAFSPDGQLLASGSSDKSVRLWDIATGALQQTFKGHSGSVNLMVFSPDGQLLASASKDKTVRLWETGTGVLQQALEIKERVTDMEISTDSSCLSTNLGYLKIQSSRDELPPSPPKWEANTFLVEGEWVTLQREKTLWLPPEYRFVCSAIKGNTLALGHASGRISIIKFRD